MLFHPGLTDAYPELILDRRQQLRREHELRAARRQARRRRVRAWVRRDYTPAEEVR